MKTASGLEYIEVQPGSGAQAEAGKTVSVHYTGKFQDGKVFDSSIPRGEPIEFPGRDIASPRVSIAGQVDQIERRFGPALHAVKVGQARLAGSGARARQLAPHQGVDQARFAHVGPADQRDFRQPVTGKVTCARSARNEFGNNLQRRRLSL